VMHDLYNFRTNETGMNPRPTNHKIQLLYDGQCPVCQNYIAYIRIREAVGQFVLINAREPSELLDEATSQNLNVDEGMVLKINGQLYHGSDAIHILSLMNTRSTWFNRTNYYLFRSKTLAKLIYPILKCLRSLLLRLIRVPRIKNLSS